MKRDDFAIRYLVALYLMHRQDRHVWPNLNALQKSFDLPRDSYLEDELPDMLESRAWARVERTHDSANTWGLVISVGGKEAAENSIDQGVLLVRNDSTPAFSDGSSTKPVISPASSTQVTTSSEPEIRFNPLIDMSPPVDSSQWRGSRLILVEASVIADVRGQAQLLHDAVYSLHLPSNSDTQDLQKLADALVLVCSMTEPEVTILDRIISSPKFMAYSGLITIIATIRGALGI